MPTKVSGRENKICEKRQRVVPKLEKMTVVEEEDVRHSLQHIKGHCKKYGVCFFFHICAGERKCNELQQEEFKATDALKQIVLDG